MVSVWKIGANLSCSDVSGSPVLEHSWLYLSPQNLRYSLLAKEKKEKKRNSIKMDHGRGSDQKKKRVPMNMSSIEQVNKKDKSIVLENWNEPRNL